jgi:hypothetical protein
MPAAVWIGSLVGPVVLAPIPLLWGADLIPFKSLSLAVLGRWLDGGSGTE